MKRIRYSKNGNNQLESRSYFTTSKGNLKVLLDEQALKYSFVDVNTRSVVLEGSSSNRTYLLRMIKSALQSLLVNPLEQETRNTRK